MKKTLLVLALLGASASASADSWIYGGASVGMADFNGSDGTAYNVHVGTGILPLIAIEAGYNRFDDFGKNDTSFDNTYLAAKPSINFGPLQVYAKGGVHKWDMDSKIDDDDGYDLMWGVGADYEVFGPLSIGLNYTSYELDHDNIDTFNLTASLNFL